MSAKFRQFGQTGQLDECICHGDELTTLSDLRDAHIFGL